MSYGDLTKLVGFSNTRTSYRMILPQRTDVYVKCGADILINGLKTDFKAEAQCPLCGNATTFLIDNRRVENLTPSDPTLHVVEVELGQGRLGIKCESTHIFDKKDCLTKWLSTYKGKPGQVFSLPGYMESLDQRHARTASPI